MELYKGRLTTDPDRHSGEGIFFVSKMLSEFAVWSDNTVYSYRCDDRDRFVQSHLDFLLHEDGGDWDDGCDETGK